MLENTEPLRNMELTPDDEKRIRGFMFLSQKPMLYVLNLGEEDAARLKEREEEFRDGPNWAAARTPRSPPFAGRSKPNSPNSAARKQRNYSPATASKESGMQRLITATYSLLGLMSFLTAGETECRAWTIPIGSKAPQAAGAIHTDFEQKFIRAEVVNWKDLST